VSALKEAPTRAPQPQTEWPRWTRDVVGQRQRRISVSIGLVVTIIVHLFALWIMPWDQIAVIEKEKPKANPPLEVEFLPPPPPLPEFVEANPMVPQEKPEDADKISFQDQVAAQEVPDETSDADAPKVEGERLDSQKIVAGDITAEIGPTAPPVMSEPAPASPPAPESEVQPEPTETPPQEAQARQPVPSETPDPADETTEAEETKFVDAETSVAPPALDAIEAIEVEEEPLEDEGFRAAIETGEAEKLLEETEEQVAQPETGEQETVEVYLEEVVISPTDAQQSSQPRPQARPRLNFVRATSGPLRNNPRSTNRMGSVAVDANFDKFGAYLQRMVESIDLQWQLLARQSATIMAEMGSRVVVRYRINQQGEITTMEVLFTSASRAGTVMCLNAIESRAPFGVWTEEMARTLGDGQTITFTFYYR